MTKELEALLREAKRFTKLNFVPNTDDLIALQTAVDALEAALATEPAVEPFHSDPDVVLTDGAADEFIETIRPTVCDAIEYPALCYPMEGRPTWCGEHVARFTPANQVAPHR